MLIKNIDKRKFFLVGANLKTIKDCTLKVIEILYRSDCIIISNNPSKNFIKQVTKICPKVYLVANLKVNNFDYQESILSLFLTNNIITYIKDGDPIFFNNGISDYNFFYKKGINVNIESGLIEVLSILNKNHIPITDRRINSTIEFINLKEIGLLNKHFKKNSFIKKIVYLENKKNIDLLIKSLYQYLKAWKITFLINRKLINFSKINKNNFSVLLKNTNSHIYLLIEKNEKI